MIKSRGSKVADWVIVFVCLLLIAVCILPMINLLARSVSSQYSLVRGQVSLWPIGFQLGAYQHVLEDSRNTWAMCWTAILTVICVFVSMVMTTFCAYPLIYDNLKGRSFFNAAFLLTMYFGAGTIPTYILLNDLKMLGTPYSLIFPFCLSVFNMIIMRSFLFGIPDSLRESAEIDGAGPLRILFKIYLPLSTSVVATLSLFYAVGRWNGYSDALMFVKQKPELYPIQLILYNLISGQEPIAADPNQAFFAENVKSAAIMFATIPILCVYPFLQRYFIAGVTLGAVKG